MDDDRGRPQIAQPADADEARVARARDAYLRGNSRLFAGDTSAAIDAYKQSLREYPEYAAGYRGLGLAYAQQGDKAEAIKALKTYVRAAPTAKDVPLVKRRIELLEHQREGPARQ